MKTKMFTLLVTIIFIGSAYTQKKSPSFAVSAGISSSFYFTDDNSSSSSSDFKTGFTAGISARFPTGVHWAIEPGLFFVQKGGIENFEDGAVGTVKATTTLNYLELPVDMYYSKRDRFFFGFGPSFGFALSGKTKFENGSDAESISLKFGSGDDDDLKSLDIGINLLGGFQFQNSLFIALNIDTGINNLSNVEGTSYSNAFMGIRLGYTFSKKQTKK